MPKLKHVSTITKSDGTDLAVRNKRIVELAAAGLNQKVIAERMGLHAPQVSAILRKARQK